MSEKAKPHVVCWVCLDEEGCIDYAVLVDHMNPDELERLRHEDHDPQLVDFGEGDCKLLEPIPPTATVLR